MSAHPSRAQHELFASVHLQDDDVHCVSQQQVAMCTAYTICRYDAYVSSWCMSLSYHRHWEQRVYKREQCFSQPASQ